MKKIDILETIVSEPQTVWHRSGKAGYGTPDFFIVEGFIDDKMDKYASRTTTYAQVRALHSHLMWDDTLPMSERIYTKVDENIRNIPLSHVGCATAHKNAQDFFDAQVEVHVQREQARANKTAREKRRGELAPLIEQLLIDTGVATEQHGWDYRNYGHIPLTVEGCERLIDILTKAKESEMSCI